MRDWLLAALMLALAVGAMTMGARENEPYTFLFDRAQAQDEQQRFLNTVIDSSGLTRAELEPLLPKMRRLGRDLPVLIALSRESKRPLGELVDLRKSGLSWMDLRKKIDLPVKSLFEGVTGAMPDPYKEAWTEWRMKYRPELTDEQVRELTLLQLTHQITGRPVADIAKERARGRTAEAILARYRPESPAPAAPAASVPAPAAKALERAAKVPVPAAKAASRPATSP